jgi:MFS family permease
MQTIAQDWLVLKLTGSGTQLGLVTAVQFLPLLLLSPFGGIVADRIDKRTILYATNTISGLLALILGILVVTGTIHLWMVYVLAASLGIVTVFNNPAQQTFVPEIVDKEHLSNAVTLNSIEVNVARAIGPALAGVIIATVGLGVCFLLNAISYIAVLVALAMMRKNELNLTQRASQKRGQLMEGLRYIRQTPVLLDTLIMMAIIGTFSYEFSVSMPLFASVTFHGGAGTYAALITATGAGSVAGGLFIARIKSITQRMIVMAALFFGITMVIAALMPNIIFAFVVLLLVGVFSLCFISMSNTALQIESRPEMRGRVMAIWSMAFLGSTPIGGPIIGFIADHLGPRSAIAAGGIAAVIAAVIGMVTIMKNKKVEKVV